MGRGWSCRRGQEAAAAFLFGKSGDGACGACQTEKIWYNGRRIMPRRCAAKGDAMRIFVAGAGAWGTALAMLLEENGHAVTLWTRNAEKAREIDVTRQNPALAGVTLPAGIRVTAELAEGNGPLSETERETVCRRLESLAEHEVTSALEQMRAWKADCGELGPRAALSDPGLWSSLESDWPEVFSRLEPEVTVRADLTGG